MQIVGDLHADGARDAAGFRRGGGHAHEAAGCAVWHARDQPVSAGRAPGWLPLRQSARAGARCVRAHEAAAVDDDFAAGNGRGGRDSLNARDCRCFSAARPKPNFISTQQV